MRAILLFTTILVLSIPGAANAQSLVDWHCDRGTAPDSGETVALNAIDGSVDGRTRFDDYERVRVVVENLNPFLTDYDIRLRREAIDEPGLARFTSIFSAVPGLLPPADDASASDASGAVPPTPASPAGLPQALSLAAAVPATDGAKDKKKEDPVNELRTVIVEAIGALAAESDGVKEALKNVQEKGGELERAVATHSARLRSDKAVCRQLVAAADDFLQATDLDGLDDAIGRLDTAVTNLESTIRTQAFAINRRAAADIAQLVVAPYQSYLATAQQKLAEARTKRRTVNAQRGAIDRTLEDPQAFRWERSGVGGEPSVVIIQTFKKGRGTAAFPATPQFVTKLSFGRQRFVLAIGAAYADLSSPEYSLDQGFVRDTDGELVLGDDDLPKFGRVVILDDGSEDRITPTLLLHTRLKGFTKNRHLSGVHLSLGITGNFKDGSADIEYLAGPSLAFAEDRFFLTLGYYYGRVDSLKDGFYEGFEAPMTLTETPVRSDRDSGWAIALSYKIN